MNQIQKTIEMRQQATTGLDKVQPRAMALKTAVEQSGLSATLKAGYLKLLNDKLTQLQTLQRQLASPNPNHYQAFIDVREQAQTLLNINQDIEKIKTAFHKATASVTLASQPNQASRNHMSSPPASDGIPEMPVAPTGPVIFKGRQPSPPRAPDYIRATATKFTDIDNLLQQTHYLLRTLNAAPTTTTEEKVQRVATVTALLKEQKALQADLDIIGKALCTARTPLTKAQCTSLDQRLTMISQKIMGLQNKITRAVENSAPEAPTHNPMRPR